MAIAYYETDQLVLALDAGRQAVFIDDTLAPAYTLLGATALELGHPAEALPYLRQAVQLDADDSQALFYLGLTYIALDQTSKAREALEQAISAAEDEPLRARLRCHLDELD
jgi:tetratricopeptide (TPR) repeat protein